MSPPTSSKPLYNLQKPLLHGEGQWTQTASSPPSSSLHSLVLFLIFRGAVLETTIGERRQELPKISCLFSTVAYFSLFLCQRSRSYQILLKNLRNPPIRNQRKFYSHHKSLLFIFSQRSQYFCFANRALSLPQLKVSQKRFQLSVFAAHCEFKIINKYEVRP